LKGVENMDELSKDEVVIDLDLIDTDELKSGRGGGKKGTGERYTKYRDCIKKKKIDIWIKTKIQSSKDGIVRVRLAQLAEKCGRKLRASAGGPGLSETGLFWGYKYVFWSEGIKTSQGRTKKEEPVAIFEIRSPDDRLPASLSKHYIEKPVKPIEPIKPASTPVAATEPASATEKIEATGTASAEDQAQTIEPSFEKVGAKWVDQSVKTGEEVGLKA
jgi:hypothetical protein